LEKPSIRVWRKHLGNAFSSVDVDDVGYLNQTILVVPSSCDHNRFSTIAHGEKESVPTRWYPPN
jgi:hypothetical protein